jgi:hypothetical protein
LKRACRAGDLDHLGQRVDQRVELGFAAPPRDGGDLQRVGRVIGRQHDAVAVDDLAAVGHHRHHRDAVGLGLGR